MSLNFDIKSLSGHLSGILQNKIDQKTKPLGALGLLEKIALKIGLIQNSLEPCLMNPALLIFAGDHGIVESGVSAYPQTVTAQMVANFLAGGAAISVFARQHGIKLLIVDAGVNAELPPNPNLVNAKIAKSTKNFLNQPAMSEQQCLSAIKEGADLVSLQQQNGCNCIGFGEMGIANTSSAALLVHCLSDLSLELCVGRGAGLNDHQLQHKLAVLQQALTRHDKINQPLDVLATYGGFEIAMMVGAYLKAAELGMLIMVDGFIASAALLVAYRLTPTVLDYCVFSHLSSESGHKALLRLFDVEPLLNLELRLGEGSGIALAFPLIQSSVNFLTEMSSFSEAGVDTANS